MSSIDAQINEILKSIKTDVEDTLLNEVFEDAKQQMGKTLDSNVYNAYSPKEYTRRGSSGGLRDEENIQMVDMDSNRSDINIEIRNMALNNSHITPGLLLDDLVEGNGTWGVGARKFRDASAEAIDNNLNETMTKGLKSRGWKVE